MIEHHFPPAGGSGSNRALAFARYLGEYGWEPVVVTPGVAWAANRDDRLLAELPAGVRVMRTRSLEARPASMRATRPTEEVLSRDLTRSAALWSRAPGGSVARSMGVVRSNVGHLKRFPDAHLGWVPFALAAARGVKYDAAYSSSGPFSSHLVGLLLKRTSGRPWVAELRDGWYRWNRAIFPDYPVWRDVLERALESAALRTADRVILVTDRMADAFRSQYAGILPPDHFATVPNGFDTAQFLDGPYPGQVFSTASGAPFEVLHAGALYYGRSLAAFLEAASRLVAADVEFARHFRLTLIGTLDPGARTELNHSALAGRTTCPGQVDHATTLRAMRNASALLLVANTTPGAEATVPGKLFEYLAVGRPVLAVAPRKSSTADVLDQTGGGWLAPAGDPAAIACVLHRAFQRHQSGIAMAADPRKLRRFERRELTADLAAIFDHAVASNPRAARRL
jgi:glycosyltransferase involved in cell wall biosynthesis